MTKLEEFVRQCTIYIEEVYDDTGNNVIGMKASANIDMEDGDVSGVSSISVVREGPLENATDLTVLLGRLALAIARGAR